MESYFKRFFIGHFLLLIIAGVCIRMGLPIVAIISGVLLFEIMIYLLDKKYLPQQKTELVNQLIEQLNAKNVSEGLMTFKIGEIDFYAEIDVDFKRGFQVGNIDIIKFHIPRTQINRLSIKPGFKIAGDKINGIETYIVYLTSGSGLDHAKEQLKEMM